MKIRVENLLPLVKTHQYEIVLGLCTLLLAYIILMIIKKAKSNFPPGPLGLPIVGYLPFLTDDMHLDFVKLGKKYGDVFSVRLGSQDIVVLHGGDAIKEAFNKPEYLGRPPNSAMEKFSPSSAFFSSKFHLWKEQRRFVVQSMKDLGLGKTKIEEDVMVGIKTERYRQLSLYQFVVALIHFFSETEERRKYSVHFIADIFLNRNGIELEL